MHISCKKEPGEGGTAKITGKVWVKDYNNSGTVLNGQFWGIEVDVYIIYGEGTAYDDRYRTSYDGTFEFKFLRKGLYKVFVYSRDIPFNPANQSGRTAIIKSVEITDKNQVIDLGTIEIND